MLTEAPKLKKIKKSMRDCLELDLQTKMAVPESLEFAPKYHNPSVYVYSTLFFNIGSTHMCACEARFVFSGTETIVGIPYEKVPGQNMKAKRIALMRMTIDELKELITDSEGFVAKLQYGYGKGCLIPSGFVIITAGDCTQGMQWVVGSDRADGERTRLMLQHMVASFPELRAASVGYSGFLEFLNNST